MSFAGMITEEETELAIESAAEKMIAKSVRKRKSSLTRRKFSLNSICSINYDELDTKYQDADCSRKISEGCLSSILHSEINDRNTDRRGAICERNEIEKELLKEALKSLFQMEQLKQCSLD